MDNQIIPSNGNGNKSIQIGPPWRCFECGAAASSLICYSVFISPRAIPTALDAWGSHIWYLHDLPCEHPARVARLGDAITSIVFPYDSNPRRKRRTRQQRTDDEREAIRLVREALAQIAALHGPNPKSDPAAAIVWQLVAGAITPEGAIREIRALVGARSTEVQ